MFDTIVTIVFAAIPAILLYRTFRDWQKSKKNWFLLPLILFLLSIFFGSSRLVEWIIDDGLWVDRLRCRGKDNKEIAKVCITQSEVTMPKIHFNGKTYNDLAEMPATEREAYKQLMTIFTDEDQDGTPDIFQGDVVGNIIEVVKKTSGDPKGAAALERMSPLMRARLSKGLAKLYALGLLTGHPDLPKEWPFPSSEEKPTWENTEIRPSKPIIQSPSAIQEDTGSRLGVLILLGLMLAICVFGVVVYYLTQLQ